MKRISLFFITLTLLLSVAAYTQATTLGFSPSDSIVPVGDTLDVELTISGLGDPGPPSLGAFDVDVMFDPAILLPTAVTFGDPVLGDQLDLFGFGVNPLGFDFSMPGIANLFELSLDLPLDLDMFQAGAFTLATLSFNAIGVGTSNLGYSFALLSDADGNFLDVQITEGSVTATPEPTTMFLLGTGIVGVAGASRRRKKNQK